MGFNNLNSQLQAAAFFVFLMEGIGFVLMFWAIYWVTKKAIKDAINESGLIQEIRRAGKEARRDIKSRETEPGDFTATR